MDIFQVRERLIGDYQDFTGSFVEIHDERIAAHFAERTDGGYQWPDPWLSLNPNFASGGTITELIEAGGPAAIEEEVRKPIPIYGLSANRAEPRSGRKEVQ